MNLDDISRFSEIDAQQMRRYLDHLPDDFESAWALGAACPLPDSFSRVTRILVAGMSEAATAGELLAALLQDSCNVPILVNRGYDLPAFADGQSTLVILVDHAGDSEEVFSALELGDARGTKMLALTTGGALADYAERSGAALWRYEHAGPARTALGWQLGLLLAFVNRLGLVRDLADDVHEAVRLMREALAVIGVESPPVQNPAKRLAGQMMGRIPFIYGAGIMLPVARRWKQQLNMNAKALALCDELPEMNHNSIAALQFLPDSIRLAPVCLAAPPLEHPRIVLRQQLTQQAFMISGYPPDTLRARGESPLAQAMYAVQHGDYVSYYLAIACGIDPTPTPAIDEIKGRLGAAR